MATKKNTTKAPPTPEVIGCIVVRNGKKVEIPKSIEGKGEAAVEKYVTDKAGVIVPPKPAETEE